MTTALIERANVIEAMEYEGDCFYDCVRYCCKELPKFRQKMEQIYLQYFDTFKNEEEEPSEVRLVRFATAMMIRPVDFENYQMLCIGEPDNAQYDTIEEFKHAITFTREYANQVTIDACIRAFDGAFGVCIVNEEYQSFSPIEWRAKRNNILLLHYDGDVPHYAVMEVPMTRTGKKMYPLLMTSHRIEEISVGC